MIKDFTPARSSLASGVVVKQHLLERNKYPQPEVTQSLYDYSGSIYTINKWNPEISQSVQISRNIVIPTGGAGGSVNQYNSLDTNPYYLDNVYGVTQSWQETIVIPSGVVTQTQSSQYEFYNGEYSGSEFIVEDGELNTECDIYKNPSTQDILYHISGNFNSSFQGFLNQQEFIQGPGEIHIWWQKTIVSQEKEYAPGYFDYIWSPAALTISKLALNGLNLEDYIPNALEYILQTAYVSGDVTLSGWTPSYTPSYNLGNLDLKVSTIQEVYTSFSGTGYYIVQLLPNPYNIIVLTDQAEGTVAIANKSSVVSVLEPYVPVGFYNSDCNPIINNTIINRLSQWYEQVDYNTNQSTPVNFQQIISGTAYPAAVQDSNYTSYQYSGIRYWGSKNTTDDFNSALTVTSSIVQTYQNDNIGITTLGYPSVNNFDTGIYEFAWGGGTYPEIAGGGAVKLSQILNVGSTSSVGIISPLTDYFASVVEQDLIPNSLPQFTQYTTTANIPNTARVMTTDFGVPTISNYMISSDTGATITAGFGGNSTLTFANSASRVTTNTSGYYITGSTIANTVMATEISNSLVSGDRWFVTLYQDLPNPVQGNLIPLNSGSINNYSVITTGSYNNPVLYNGVFEISTSVPTGTPTLYLYNDLPTNSGGFGNGGYGMLIWKAITDGTFVLFNGATLSGVGKGNLITSTASPTIKNNLTYITQEYGTNPKNQ